MLGEKNSLIEQSCVSMIGFNVRGRVPVRSAWEMSIKPLILSPQATFGLRGTIWESPLSAFGDPPLKQSEVTTIPKLIETFDALGDWEAQCDYLIDLGYDLPEFPEAAKTEKNRVHGCQSNVWLMANLKLADPPAVEILADSDSLIVKGLIAVLLMAYSGRTAQEILDTDIKEFFARLGLNRQLSSARRNGLFGMVQRIRSIAAQAETERQAKAS